MVDAQLALPNTRTPLQTNQTSIKNGQKHYFAYLRDILSSPSREGVLKHNIDAAQCGPLALRRQDQRDGGQDQELRRHPCSRATILDIMLTLLLLTLEELALKLNVSTSST